MNDGVTGHSLRALKDLLDDVRDRYHRRAFITPDPLQFLHLYEDPGDRELVGLLASSLAFGRVEQIVRTIESVLGAIGRPRRFATTVSRGTMSRTLQGFRYRYVGTRELTNVLFAAGRVVEAHGSLGACLAHHVGVCNGDVAMGLSKWVEELRSHFGREKCYLLPSPVDGSACKRLHLYLRWMVRCDEVDPGGWPLPPSCLMVPLDTHMHRIARALGLTARRQADGETVREITMAFRVIAPEDPVRYDFALTRLGIRSDGDLDGFLRECHVRVKPDRVQRNGH